MLLKYLSMHLRSKLEYKVPFILIVIAQTLTIGTSYIAMYSLFSRFGSIKGFTLYDVLISFSVINIGFSSAEFIGRGFDRFKKLIKSGTFDLLLIKPRNIYLQIIGSNIAYEKIGRVIGTVIILIYAISKSDTIVMSRVWIIAIMCLSSIIIFLSLFIIGAAITFYTIEGLEVVNIFTDGSKEMGQYPIGIFNDVVLKFFTYIIPIACINYYPLLYLLGKSNSIISIISPLLGMLIIVPAVLIFNYSLKHYQGTGS